jgi:hypothetical protein
MKSKNRLIVLALVAFLTLASNLAFADPGTGGGPGLGHKGVAPGVCKTCK